VFAEIATHTDISFGVSMTYIEIYNDQLVDLLDPANHNVNQRRNSNVVSDGGAICREI
jgi:hypothetical protein